MVRGLTARFWLRRRAIAMRSAAGEERGQTLMMAALLLPILLGMVGLVIDVGFANAARRQAQNAVDESAIAAAYALKDGYTPAQAGMLAREYTAGNGYDNAAADVTVTVNVPPLSGPHAGDSNYAEVIVGYDAPELFITVLGQNTGTISARAVAGIAQVPGDYALITLNPSECRSLDVSGSGNLIVEGSGIMVNSDCSANALRKTGSSSIIADVIDIVGGYSGPSSSCPPLNPSNPPNNTVCGNPNTGQSFIADPLFGMAEPNLLTEGISPDSGGTAADPDTKHISNGDFTFRPGVYYGGIKLTTTGNITFLPGTYVMAGGGLEISSSGTVYGNGVMFFNTFDPDAPNAPDGRCSEIRMSGSTNTGSALTGPSSAPYKDIIFWQDDDCVNNQGDGLRFHHSGSGTLETTGIIYMPTGWLDVSGSGNIGTVQIIVDTFDKSGSSDVVIDYGSFVEVLVPTIKLVE